MTFLADIAATIVFVAYLYFFKRLYNWRKPILDSKYQEWIESFDKDIGSLVTLRKDSSLFLQKLYAMFWSFVSYIPALVCLGLLSNVGHENYVLVPFVVVHFVFLFGLLAPVVFYSILSRDVGRFIVWIRTRSSKNS